MLTLGKEIMEKIKKREFVWKKVLEGDFNRLKENMIYGQEILQIGSWTYDITNEEIFYSEGVYPILDCNPLGLNENFDEFYSYVHPDDLEELKEAVQHVLDGMEYEMEFRIVTSNKVEKFIHEKTKVIFDEEKNPIKIIGTIQDITKHKLIENDLKEIGDNLNLAQRVYGIGSWKYDAIKDEIFYSEEVYRIYDIDIEKLRKSLNSFFELIHYNDRDKVQNAMDMCLVGKSYELEYCIPHNDGTEKYILTKGEPIFSREQKVIGILGIIQDITEKKKMQEKVNNSQKQVDDIQKKFQALIKNTSDILQIITKDGIIEYTSPAVKKSLGYESKEIINKSIFEIFEEDNKTKLNKMLELALSNDNKRINGEIKTKTKNGKEIYLEIIMNNFLMEPTIKGILVDMRDITIRKKMELEMEYIADHDMLTKLPNINYLNKQIESLCKEAKKKDNSFALMKLDINSLKNINKTLGYGSGDKLIIQVSQRLQNYLGSMGIICRKSGERFAIIIPNSNTIGEYSRIAKEIIGLFSNPFNIDMYEIYITVNIGISIYKEDGEDPDAILKNADTALNRAKGEGQNRYVFHSSNMDINEYKRFMLINDLRKAIKKDQFKLYYQPQVNLKTNELLGAEALIRWEHPTWGIVEPKEFIHLAEETGYIIDLGNWVLREVCSNYKQWLKDKLPGIKVSINYSGAQFFEKGFIENIKRTIDEFGLDANFLIIEITENIFMCNSKRIILEIEKLRDLGIQIALDDFGTGFSSLAYLNEFPVDVLKIDRSFIKNIPTNEISTKITENIVKLAQELRVKIVAEGIENWNQLSFLRKVNCYTGQGYLYSKPIPQEDFVRVLATKKCKPINVNSSRSFEGEERRRFFRIDFYQLLEADMTIMKIDGQATGVGNTKVIIKNMGPGGLCFVSNIRLPINRNIVLKFTTELLGKDIMVYGCPVWKEETDDDLHEYGIEFTFDENERMALTGVLNQLQVKLRNNTKCTDGRFVSVSPARYFSSENTED